MRVGLCVVLFWLWRPGRGVCLSLYPEFLCSHQHFCNLLSSSDVWKKTVTVGQCINHLTGSQKWLTKLMQAKYRWSWFQRDFYFFKVKIFNIRKKAILVWKGNIIYTFLFGWTIPFEGEGRQFNLFKIWQLLVTKDGIYDVILSHDFPWDPINVLPHSLCISHPLLSLTWMWLFCDGHWALLQIDPSVLWLEGTERQIILPS